jgi:lactoylglutathione lyase
MPASLRIEIFPSNLQRCIDFYTNILQFKLIQHEKAYIYMKRDNIFIGAIPVPSEESASDKAAYRRPTKGVEIVFEVEDLEADRDGVVHKGWPLDADIQLQPWGLRDFRIVDPDGYYIRITTHSPKNNTKGEGK